MNVALLVLFAGVLIFLLWVLAGLISDMIRPALDRLHEAMSVAHPLQTRPALLPISVASHRGKFDKTSGERMAMLAVVFAGMTVSGHSQQSAAPQESGTQDSSATSTSSSITWQYGGFLDAGSLHDFNDPANHLFRSRGTAFHVNELNLEMTAAYLRKSATESSRWGMEATAQTGDDALVFGYSATAPNLDGSKVLRHFGPTDVSYLASVGKGLTLQGGIFNSFIGYDSLYAKDNFNYTRPWGADFTPYLMMGVNAQYSFTPKLSAAGFVVNGYWHLANANNVPSTGGQLAVKPNDRLTLKQTVLLGPHQSDTSFQFWRFLSDSIAEWKPGAATIAFEYQISEEKLAITSSPRALWMSSQLPVHYGFDKHWSATVRPEVAWDRNGRWTGYAQTVKAVSSTLEYRTSYRATTEIVRLEHRWDDSHGPQGGFFTGPYVAPGVVAITPSQQLLGIGVILTFDSAFSQRRRQ